MCGFGSGTIYKVGVQYITTMYWQRLPEKYIESAQYINTFLWSMQSVTVAGYILPIPNVESLLFVLITCQWQSDSQLLLVCPRISKKTDGSAWFLFSHFAQPPLFFSRQQTC